MARALLIVVVGVILISCAITPPLYFTISTLWSNFPWPYSRVFDRVILVVAVALLVWQRKQLKLSNFSSLFGSHVNRWKLVTAGFVCAACSALAVMPLVVVDVNGLTWSDPATLAVWIERFGKVMATAVVVSLLEELLFRGALYQSLRKKWSHYSAATVVSFVYAIVHFLTPNKSFHVTTWNPLVGFEYFGTLLLRLLEPGIVSGLFGLWLVGMVLAQAVSRTKGLYLSIGLHAGWIFAAKASMYLTQELPGAQFPSGLGRRYFLVGTPEVWGTFLLAFLLLSIWQIKKVSEVEERKS